MDRIETVRDIYEKLANESPGYNIRGHEMLIKVAIGRTLEAIAAQTPQWSDELPAEHGEYWERHKINIGEAVTPEGEYQGEIVSDQEGETNWREHHFTSNRQWAKATPPASKGE